jgi:ribonuclease BN (tRNA processing enzyme)
MIESFYDPESYAHHSYIKLWGTRGSVPVSGTRYSAFGGDTCCLEIRSGDTLVIIDAGTGIRPLGIQLYNEGIRHFHLMLGHTHWDHIMGFPFFAPVHIRDNHIDVYGYPESHGSLQSTLETVLDPAYFPVGLGHLASQLNFHNLQAQGEMTIGPVRVRWAPANHPGGALGFLIEKGERRIGYVTDNEVLEGYHGDPSAIHPDDPRLAIQRPLIDLLSGCDTLIHEAQYRPRVYRQRTGWGHSSLANAALFAKLCKVRDWVITHHDPIESDTDIREKRELVWRVLADLDWECHVSMAFDGLLLPL